MLIAYIVSIGDEILSGRTQDTNSNYIARRLYELGIFPKSIITIGDDKQVIQTSISTLLEDADIIFTTGGLGPTPDDNTTISVANILKRKLILDETIIARVEKYFEKQKREVPELATKQALIPQGAITLDNPVGQAAGLILKQVKKTIILLPGVPIELEKIFETGVLPYLNDTYLLKPDFVLNIRTTNISEMVIVEKISGEIKRHKEVRVAYLPSIEGVDVQISGIKDKKTYAVLEKELVARLKPWIYCIGQENIEEVIGHLCRKKQLTVSVAESCTGGLISDKITNIPGSSDYFIGSAVVYSNKLKKLIGDVKEETLKKFGAVSKETVLELAQGIRKQFNTDIGLSVSGIAGPSGATKDKPIGLIFVGIATKRGSSSEQHIFNGNRRMIKEKSAMAALDLLRRTIESL
jgi:nicotinamide-nucleotide amidase